MGKCKFPKCNQKADGTWALVDLCSEHLKGIRIETDTYYRRSIYSYQRYLYNQISWLIPWSREAMR